MYVFALFNSSLHSRVSQIKSEEFSSERYTPEYSKSIQLGNRLAQEVINTFKCGYLVLHISLSKSTPEVCFFLISLVILETRIWLERLLGLCQPLRNLGTQQTLQSSNIRATFEFQSLLGLAFFNNPATWLNYNVSGSCHQSLLYLPWKKLYM